MLYWFYVFPSDRYSVQSDCNTGIFSMLNLISALISQVLSMIAKYVSGLQILLSNFMADNQVSGTINEKRTSKLKPCHKTVIIIY